MISSSSILRTCIAALAFMPLATAHAAETPTAPVKVTVTAKGCDPANLSVPAGTTTFQIVNKSTRVLEWEILKGVMVVDERENIAPGFTQKLTTKLEAGDYAITCGLLSNPQGKLTVTAGEPGTTEASVRPTMADLIGASAEYRVYLLGETSKLVTAATALGDAINAGDIAKASEQFTAAHAAYLHLKPAVALFADLDANIDGTDFHKLADGLFTAKSTADLAPMATTLNADIAELQAQLKSTSATPEIMVKGAATVLGSIAADAPAADQPVAMGDLKAKLDGARRVLDLFAPLVARADKAAADRISAALADIQQKLGSTAPSDADRKALGDALAGLSGNVAKLSVTLGLSQS